MTQVDSTARRCYECGSVHPLTADFFYLSKGKFDRKCRRCRIASSVEAQRRQRERKGIVITPRAWVRPTPLPPARKSEPFTGPILSVWRGPIPQGYGATT